MNENRSPILRLLAPIALVAAAVVVMVVVTSSLSESDDEATDAAAKQEKAAQGSGDKFYFVQPGDSLSTIADKEGVDPVEIEQLNPDLDPQTLAPGQRVRLR